MVSTAAAPPEVVFVPERAVAKYDELEGKRVYRRPRIHSRGPLIRLLDRLRGWDQLLIRAGDTLPLVVASYPRGHFAYATALESALGSTFRSIPEPLRTPYAETLARVPTLLVTVLRGTNPCGCLGHHHPSGAEGRLARRLACDTGHDVGEIDLAIEAIRKWEPLPLAAIEAQETRREIGDSSLTEFAYFRFHTAVLSIFLHELEHLAFPDRPESVIRQRSNEFYLAAVQDFAGREFGATFGIRS